jgi:hypothetical protein
MLASQDNLQTEGDSGFEASPAYRLQSLRPGPRPADDLGRFAFSLNLRGPVLSLALESALGFCGNDKVVGPPAGFGQAGLGGLVFEGQAALHFSFLAPDVVEQGERGVSEAHLC